MIDIRTKRVYEPVDEQDGFRVLVDRLWPRGKTKEQVHADLWLKDVAPSAELRKWFHHGEANWETFKGRYFGELDEHQEAVAQLYDIAQEGRLTLLFSAQDVERNQAIALKEYLLAWAENRGG